MEVKDVIQSDRLNLETARGNLHQAKLENHKTWDTQMLGLSTLLLGLSVTMMKGVIDFDVATFKFLLYLSWLSFWTTIVGTSTSFWLSDVALKKATDLVDKRYGNLTIVALSQSSIKQKTQSLSNEEAVTAYLEKEARRIDVEIERFEQDLKPLQSSIDSWSGWIYFVNLARTIAFILGFTLLTLFAAINI